MAGLFMLFVFSVAFFGLLLFPIPIIIAVARKHPNAVAIIALDILLGWTFLGWVVALVWSLTATNRK